MADNLQDTIAKICNETGLDKEDAAERAVAEHNAWHFGERVRIVEDDEGRGLYAGEEGYLLIHEVGAPEHNNVRVSMSILMDGYDSPGGEVTPDDFEAVA